MEGVVTRRLLVGRGLTLAASLAAGPALMGWLRRHAAQGTAWAQQSLARRIKGLPPEITPNDRFYTVSKNFFDPDVDARTWKLRVAGLVESPLTFTLDDLKAFPAVVRPHTFECISNPVGGDLIGNAVWKGLRFRDLLQRVQPKSTVTRVIIRSADGYHTAIAPADLMDPDALLAYEMNREPLSKAHGFPLRAVIPGRYGMKNPKWITALELTDREHRGYWESQGWSDRAVVKTMSKFATPWHGGTVPAGTVDVGGVAYAGDRGIQAVELSVDHGKTWREAEVKPAMGKHAWVLWGIQWDVKPGRYLLKVRARDGSGALQESTPGPPLPEGATGYQTIRVTVG